MHHDIECGPGSVGKRNEKWIARDSILNIVSAVSIRCAVALRVQYVNRTNCYRTSWHSYSVNVFYLVPYILGIGLKGLFVFFLFFLSHFLYRIISISTQSFCSNAPAVHDLNNNIVIMSSAQGALFRRVLEFFRITRSHTYTYKWVRVGCVCIQLYYV